MTDRVRLIYRPPWRIELTQRANVRVVLSDADLTRAIDRALRAADAPAPAAIGLILTGDREIAALNATHMGHKGPTDVLSFPLLPPEAFPGHPGKASAAKQGQPSPPQTGFPPPGRRIHLGEIVISVERAVEQAAAGRGGQTGDVRWSSKDELRLLVTHGALHICGWDHATRTEEGAMRAMERKLLERVQTG